MMISFVDRYANGMGNQTPNEKLTAALRTLCPNKKESFRWTVEDERGKGNFKIFWDSQFEKYVILAEYPDPESVDRFKGITLRYTPSGELTQYYLENYKKVDGVYLEGKVSKGEIIFPNGSQQEKQNAQESGLKLILHLAEHGKQTSTDLDPPSSGRSR